MTFINSVVPVSSDLTVWCQCLAENWTPYLTVVQFQFDILECPLCFLGGGKFLSIATALSPFAWVEIGNTD